MMEDIQKQQDSIPVVDLSQEDSTAVASELLNAFKTIGFATLTHHGVDRDLIQSAFAASKSFFDLPESIKTQYKYESHASNRGYIGVSNEKHESGSTADYKETFDIGNEEESGYANKWPSHDCGISSTFRDTLLKYYNTMDKLHLRIMKLLGVALKLPDPEHFVNRCDQKHENLRLLHYKPIDCTKNMSPSDEPIVRGAVHTDYGTITLLVQDSVGGLRVQRVDGGWLSVTPVEDSIVVNVGDMFQRWSNDVLKATPHQVVEARTNANGIIPERYSIAFFCNANKDCMLECLEQFQSEDNPAKYSPVNAHAYLTMRLTQTISTGTDKPKN
jgi:isopenicillin N synthase-like dioxygenase